MRSTGAGASPAPALFGKSRLSRPPPDSRRMKPDHMVFLLVSLSLCASALLAYVLLSEEEPQAAAVETQG